MLKLFTFISIFFFSIPFFAQPFPGKIGTNLDGIGGIAKEFPNITLTAGTWQSIANNGSNATTDSLGWPTEDFRVVFFDFRPFNAWNSAPDDPGKYVTDMSGTYTMSFKGKANLTSWSDATIQFLNQLYDSVTNTTTLNIFFPAGGGANKAIVGNYGFLMVNFNQTQFTAGTKGVKEIRLMRPGYTHKSPQLFNTEYINALSPFSTLRFMDFLRTNNIDSGYPKKQTWNNRQKANAPRYSKGAPWESIISIANLSGKDIWINIPVDADSNYIVELAKLMKYTLRNDINIYIEYSNEVWNGDFTQYKYNYDAVLQSTEDADIRSSTTFDDRRRARRVAKQVIKAGKIFEQVMGITVASRTRIRPVFAWQIGGWLPWYDDVLNWINTTYGAPKNYIYAIASAPYFGEGNAAPNATPQQIVSAMSASSDANIASIKVLALYANQWQLKHLQYEGGPDNGGGSTVNIENRILANRLSDMKTTVIHNYTDNWFSANANGTAPIGTNDLANYFTMTGRVSRYGCWGATEDLKYIHNLVSAPKYDALCTLTGKCGKEPTVAIVAPLNNSSYTVNFNLNISATAADTDGTISKVEFFVGSTLVGIDSISPYAVSWIPSQAGVYAISVKAIDNDGKYTFAEPNIITVNAGSNGILSNSIIPELNIFPVPTSDQLQVTISSNEVKNSILEVFDFLGKKQFEVSVNQNAMIINTSKLKNGIYFLNLKTEEGNIVTRRFIVNR